MSERDDQGGYVTFQEMEDAAKEPAKTDLSQIKFEGDEVPEAIRGKTAAEVADQLKAMRESLEISENARLALRNSQEALETSRRFPEATPVAVPAAMVQDDDVSDEQLQALWEQNPAVAMRKLNDSAIRKARREISAELGSQISALSVGTAGSVEQMMRGRFPEEFEILGREIEAVKAQVPDKTVFSNPQAWEQLIYYTRGQNMDKLLSAKDSKREAARLAEAQREEAARAPANFSSRGSRGSSNGGGSHRNDDQFDDVQKEIAAKLGVSLDAWKR